MNLLAAVWDRPLGQATYDAYMIAVLDAEAEDFARAVESLITADLRAMPTPHQLRAEIQQRRMHRTLRARDYLHTESPAEAAARVARRAALLAGIGASGADQSWWTAQALRHDLPRGMRTGLFVPPRRDRHAAIVVAAELDAQRWQMNTRARARAAIGIALAQRYGLLREIVAVALPDVLAELTGADAPALASGEAGGDGV